jgi:radical SAM protein with 4Fe4S-binding SPASM domain
VTAITQINRQNLGELESIRELLRGHGVCAWQLQLGTPSGNLADHPDLVLRPEDILDVVPRVAAMRRARQSPPIQVGDNIGYYGELEADLRAPGGLAPFWCGCQAGCGVLGLESHGNVKGCLALPSERNGVDRFVEGNLRTRTLREIWESADAFAYTRKFRVEQLGGFCRTCEYAEICRGGCSWSAFSHAAGCSGNAFCYYRQAVERGLIRRDSQRDSRRGSRRGEP